MRSRFIIPNIGIVILLVTPVIRSDDSIDYQRQVQPILAEHCVSCHGVDEESRESGLRLDVRKSTLQGGDSGEAAIVPGDAEASELISRILSSDPDMVMPPPTANKPLNESQKQHLYA